jgi:predicted AlkP superfamily phosphohydrolase/phosphomutase
MTKLYIAVCTLMIVGLTGCGNGSIEKVDKYSDPESPRVLIIGFDGATWDMFYPAIEKGQMPRLKTLVEQGAHGPLETILPTLTPVVWTTIATGRMPEDHGVVAVVDKDPETGQMRPLDSHSTKVKPMWRIISGQDKDVSIVRWPLTWPVEIVNGEMVSDYAFQRQRDHRTWPERLTSRVDMFQETFTLNDIRNLTGADRFMYENLDPEWQWKLMVLLREYQLDVQFKNVATSLFGEKQRSLSAVYFYSLDALGHNFFKFLNNQDDFETPDFSGLLMKWCSLYDDFLGDLLDSIDSDTYVIICSDHGMDLALEPQQFLIFSEDTPPDTLTPTKAPDLPPGPSYDTNPFAVNLVYTAPTGQHTNKPDGVFLIAGPAVVAGKTLSSMHVTEILPTVLYLLGLPVADDFSAKPRLDLFKSDFTSQHSVRRIESYESDHRLLSTSVSDTYHEEDDLLLNRLQALGYIE